MKNSFAALNSNARAGTMPESNTIPEQNESTFWPRVLPFLCTTYLLLFLQYSSKSQWIFPLRALLTPLGLVLAIIPLALTVVGCISVARTESALLRATYSFFYGLVIVTFPDWGVWALICQRLGLAIVVYSILACILLIRIRSPVHRLIASFVLGLPIATFNFWFYPLWLVLTCGWPHK